MNTESAVISAVCKNKDMATLLLSNVDEFFQSHRDVWDGLKSYYYKFKAVPDVEVLTERFKDFQPEQAKGGTEYYLDKLREEYIASKMRALLLKHGTNLKSNSAFRVLTDMQADLSSISKLSNVARDLREPFFFLIIGKIDVIITRLLFHFR